MPTADAIRDDEWDVFISHASEDAAAVAQPLARRLRAAGLRVWIYTDTDQLDISDDLRKKINAGLARSRFGVAVLSDAYLDKKWTTDELGALLAREDDEYTVVIPVVHELAPKALESSYPLLAARLQVSTSKGLRAVAEDIVRVVFAKGADSPSQRFPTVRRRLVELLDSTPDHAELRAFLEHHPVIVRTAVGASAHSVVRWPVQLGDVTPDVCIGELLATVGRHQWEVVVLGPTTPDMFESDGPSPEVAAAVARLKDLRRWVEANYDEARRQLPDIASDFSATVVAGRRNAMSEEQRDRLADYNDMLFGTRVRTYDWLVESAPS